MIFENKIIKIKTKNDGRVIFCIESEEYMQKIEINIFDDDKLLLSKRFSANSKKLETELKIENPKLWRISKTHLYRYVLIIDEQKIQGTFGFREISTSGKYVTLNDKPIFIRGYIRGIAAHDHENNYDISEEEFYRKNIRIAKDFGFNLVRFHSSVPSETFFKVADEEGILVHIEMRPPTDGYNNLTEMVDTRTDFVNRKFIIETINKFFNHPSLAIYCLGNEFKNLSQNDTIFDIGKMVKEIDPSRLYLDTCAWGENNRPLVDIDVQHMSYYFPFGKHADMYDDTENLIVGDFNKGKEIVFNVPLIAHEVCHYTALRDFKNLKDKYKKHNLIAPWWINEELKMISAKGFDQIYPKMYMASKYFQKNCWKIAYEAMRRSKLLGGFMFLQLADTDRYENSNGIIDCFDDINGIKPNDFNIFNGDIVLLTKLNKCNYFDSENLDLDVFISRFDERKLEKATLRITLGKQTKVFKDVRIDKHDYYQICKTSFELEKTNVKKLTKLQLELVENNEILSVNSYNIWVYPTLNKMLYNEFIDYSTPKFNVTTSLSEALMHLKQNKDVLLIYRSLYTRHVLNKTMPKPVYSFKASWNRFKPVIWDRGTNFGGLIDTQNLKKYGFKEEFIDLDFSKISEDCDKIILDDFPGETFNLISGIDKCNRDRFDAYKSSFNLPELMYDRTLRNFSYLFETRIGGARLVVCGLNLLGLNDNEPSARYMADTLLKYMENNKNIKDLQEISFNTFKNYVTSCATEPVKERIMTQFWEMDDSPVESQTFWKESRGYLTKKDKNIS